MKIFHQPQITLLLYRVLIHLLVSLKLKWTITVFLIFFSYYRYLLPLGPGAARLDTDMIDQHYMWTQRKSALERWTSRQLMISCSPTGDAAQALRVRPGIPLSIISLFTWACFITAPSWEMCSDPLCSCLNVPPSPASNSFSNKKEKKVAQEVTVVLIIYVPNSLRCLLQHIKKLGH